MISGAYRTGIPSVNRITLIMTSILLFYGALKFIGYCISADLVLDRNIFPANEKLGDVPINQMSPYTGLLFVISGIGVFLNVFGIGGRKRSDLIALSGMLVAFMGFIAVSGYVLGAPFLYGEGIIPLATPTALAFLFLGAGIMVMPGSHSKVVRQLTDNSSSARLLRVILPLLVSGILMEGFLITFLTRHYDVNPALVVAFLTLFFIIVTSLLIIQATRLIFRNADLAESKRIEAEATLRRSEQFNRSLVEVLPVGILYLERSGVITYENPAMEKIMGVTHNTGSTVIGMNFFDIPPIKNAVSSVVLERIREGKEIHGHLVHYHSLMGTEKDLEVSTIPLKDTVGDLLGTLFTATDITERNTTQAALLSNQAHMTQLLQTATDGIIEINSLGIVCLFNHAAENLFGYKAAEIIGQNLDLLIPEEYKNLHRQGFARYLATGKSKVMGTILELNGKHKDGRIFPLELSLSEVYLGGEHNFIGIIRDLTERKQFEKKIADSEEIYRTLVENATDQIFLVDHDYRLISANQASLQLLKSEPGEVKGKTIRKLFPEEVAEKYIIHLEHVFNTREPLSVEEVLVLGGDQFVFHISLNPISDASGKIQSVLGIVRDMTEYHRAKETIMKIEKQYSELFESIPDGIYKSTHEGKFIEVNPAMVRMFGYESKEEMLKIDIKSRIYFEESDWKAAISEIKSGDTVVFRLRKKDGSEIWVEESGRIVEDEHGRILGHEGVLRDVTSRRTAEMELERFVEELATANATKDKFFSIIAHDLKNPFGTIYGLSSILLEEIHTLNKNEIEGSLRKITSYLRNTNTLLENLLEWAQSQSGRIRFNPGEVDLCIRLTDILALMEVQAFKKDIRIYSDLPVRCVVYADAAMLDTVLRNLVSNGIKFTPRQGEIRVAIARKDNHVEVSVSDSGTGIPADHLSKLFMIDSKYSLPGTENEKGTGLGLILCKEFVEKHGGRIWAESEPGKGSTFRFTLPV